MLAPFGVGVLYARQRLAESSLPFLYGGDMIAEGRVFPEYVEYNSLPWKYAAGTPNILGTVAFHIAGRDPVSLAECLNRAGVEARAGCHCATLAHHSLKLTSPASCRLSFYLYNTPEEVDRAVAAVAAIAAHRYAPRALSYRPWSWQPGRSPGHVSIPARSS
jgi:selenocysteine lyase/cysteine desulfurase